MQCFFLEQSASRSFRTREGAWRSSLLFIKLIGNILWRKKKYVQQITKYTSIRMCRVSTVGEVHRARLGGRLLVPSSSRDEVSLCLAFEFIIRFIISTLGRASRDVKILESIVLCVGTGFGGNGGGY